MRTSSQWFVFILACIFSTSAFAANDSEFISQNVRAIAAAGSTFSVSLTFKNTGSTTWSTDGTPHRLGSQAPPDNTTWGLGRVGLTGAETIATNAQKTFTFNVTAPLDEDEYAFQWKMVEDGVEWIGEASDLINLEVTEELSVDDCTDGYVGLHNTVGLESNTKYLCYSNQWHDCGESTSASWHTHATNNQQVGDWKCDLSNTKWVPKHGSQFISQTVPEIMETGSNYTVSVTFKNVGWETWADDAETPFRLGSQNPEDTTRWGLGRVFLGESEEIDRDETKTFTFVVSAPDDAGTYNFQWKMVQDTVEWFGELSANRAIIVRDSDVAGDCTEIYIGYNDELGITDDKRFLCHEMEWYRCSSESSESWVTQAANNEERGSWICDRSVDQWRYRGQTAFPDRFPLLALGADHTCATTHDGLVCWGSNAFGQLGDGTTVDSAAPVLPFNLPLGVQAVAAGEAHTCALSHGRVYCWGSNVYGQLGNGRFIESYEPLRVTGISHATALAAGDNHTCAIEDGGLKCWGRNDRGQIGDLSLFGRRSPVVPVGMDSAVTAIALGCDHSCAVQASALYCWGASGGNGTNVDLLEAQAISVDEPRQIVAGASHACALSANGVECWGNNALGQLGDGTTDTSLSPVGITGSTGGIQTIAAGARHTCAMVNGGVKCWGDNAQSQLGLLSGSTSIEQALTASVEDKAHSLFAGFDRTCVVRGGGIECFGSNDGGALGAATELPASALSVSVLGIDVGVQAIANGESFTCAIINGGAECWGKNDKGQLGISGPTGVTGPHAVSGLAIGVQAIAAGKDTACAIIGGAVKCWGANGQGQIGDGTTTDRNVPTSVTGLSGGAHAVAVADQSSCALVGGIVKCWGDNAYGQLADGTTTDRTSPVAPTGWTKGLVSLSAGGEHFCARAGVTLRCWGRGDEGQLGKGTSSSSLPVAPSGPSGVTGSFSGSLIVAGSKHTCATKDGDAYCWGRGDEGQLGLGSTSDKDRPNEITSLSHTRAMVAGRNHTCAFAVGGMKCWGDNTYGQLGDGTTTARNAPVFSNAAPVNMVGVAAGDSTCVITGTITAGGVKCWGRNDSGQLADGTTTNRTGAVGATGLTTACDALDCGDLGFDCGAAADRCGGMLACGTCSSPEYCGGGGDANECGGCLSTTCAAEGVRCGQAYDATCAVAIDCGACGGGDLCAE